MKYFLIIICSFAFSKVLTITLVEAEKLAITQNKEIRMLESLLRKAEMGRLEAVSKWLPKVEALSFSFVSSEDQIITETKSAFVSQLALTQSVFESDVYYGIKLARLEVEHLRFLLLAAKNDILFKTRSLFYKVVLDKNSLATRCEHVNLMASLAKEMMDNFSRGTAKLYSVNQAKVAAANATTGYYEALRQLKVDEVLLSKVLGYDPGAIDIEVATQSIPIEEIPELEEKLLRVEKIFSEFALEDLLYRKDFPQSQYIAMRALFTEREVEEWEGVALARRPALLEQKNAVHIAEERVRKGYGEYLPSFSLTGGYGGIQSPWSFDPSNRFWNQKFNANIGLSASWTLFDGLGRERRIEGAKANRRAMIYKLEGVREETLADVRESIYAIESAIAQFATAEGNVRLSRQTIAQAKEQLQIGYVTIFDYQIAVDSYIDAENNRNKARYALIQAYYGLRHAAGIDSEGV